MVFPVVDGMRSLELGNPGPMRQRLNQLVLAGAKVATFGLLTEYIDEPTEHVGEHLALLDDAGARIATVEVVASVTLPAGAVTWDMVEAEGEGDGTVAEWRAGHADFWATEGVTLTDATELHWIRFRLVDPRPPVLRSTAGDLGLPEGFRHRYTGKVRELFETPTGELLFVASDRISAYDWVLPTEIPGKGAVLTAMSRWWFAQLADIVDNHMTAEPPPPSVAERAMVCRPLDMLPVECVARGYLSGSGLADYRRTGAVCGNPLPAGLVDGSQLPEPIFTPATKAELGEHDENVDFAAVTRTVGHADAELLRDLTLACYRRGEELARERGIILADTKFEFGRMKVPPQDAAAIRNTAIVLADEVLTPDSSRFWPADRWDPGQPGGQPSYDKQYVRDWLTSPEAAWDRQGPPPPLPQEVVARTRDLYLQALRQLTGRDLG